MRERMIRRGEKAVKEVDERILRIGERIQEEKRRNVENWGTEPNSGSGSSSTVKMEST